MRWANAGYRAEHYHNDAGRILGGVTGEHRSWLAWLDGKGSIGRYIDEPSAKRAVEKAVSPSTETPE